MGTKIEGSQSTSLTTCEAPATVRHIREIRVNYRGPKREPVKLLSASDAIEFVRKVIPDNSREHFIALYLDAAHHVISYAVVFTGTANACIVHPREVFQRAVLVGASAIVVSHNHPSGQPSPSEEDRKVTRLLKSAGECLGIALLDHVIVTRDTHYSFAEHGEL